MVVFDENRLLSLVCHQVSERRPRDAEGDRPAAEPGGLDAGRAGPATGLVEKPKDANDFHKFNVLSQVNGTEAPLRPEPGRLRW